MTDTGRPDGSTLKVSCKNTDCARDLHSFRASKEQVKSGTVGSCRTCGANLIDWPRVHSRDLGDVANTFEAMKREWIRHRYWHKELNQHAINYALRKGCPQLSDTVVKKIIASLAAAEPYRDGWGTPWEARNPIPYGQHAVAACCRACVEEWHAIPRGRPLSNEEITYLSELVMLYINERVPGLTDEGQYVPPILSKGN